MTVITADVSLLSLDASLALVGGYAGTIWLIIGCIFGGFANFAYQNSLVREFVKKRTQTSQVDEEEKENANNLKNIVDTTKPVVFSYASYLTAKWASSCFCCCFRGISCMKKALRQKNLHDKAMNKISNEIDIRGFIKASRVSHLMTKMFLKPN